MPPPDDLLSALDAAPGVAPQPDTAGLPTAGPPDPGTALTAGLDAAPGMDDPTVAMRAAATAAKGLSAQQAAQASTLANRMNLPTGAALGTVSQVQADRPYDDAHYQDIAQNHPDLAQWLSDPAHAGIARDDLMKLRDLSRTVQAATGTVDNHPMTPLMTRARFGLQGTGDFLTKTLMAGPAWLQQKVREDYGITGDPWSLTPLGMVYNSQDWDSYMQARQALSKPDALGDLVQGATQALSDPTAFILPLKGAGLAIEGTRLIGEAAVAKAAITGAAAVQGELAGAQTMVRQAEERQQSPEQAPGAIAATANIAAQTALGFFFGKLGQEPAFLRLQGIKPSGASPLKELASDALKQAVSGGTAATAQGEAGALLTEGRTLTPEELFTTYASGAIPGAVMVGASLPEAIQARHHVTVLRNAEGLQFGNKVMEAVDAVKASAAAKASPEEIGKLVDAIAAKGISHGYMQADDWQSHFIERGLDPVDEAAKAGLKDEYLRARGLGGDMQVPLRVIIGMGQDAANPEALVARVRSAPNAPNVVEAAKFFQSSDKDLQQNLAFAKMQIEASAGAGDTEGQTLHEAIKSAGIAAGLPDGEASSAALLHQRFFKRLADQFNAEQDKIGGNKVTPTDIANQFALSMRRALPDAVAHLQKTGQLEAALNELRTKGPEQTSTKALRSALARLGLDATQHSSEEINAKLEEVAGRARGPQQPGPTGEMVDGRHIVLTDIPYAGGISKDGQTVYIDRRIPKIVKVNGKDVHAWELIGHHEVVEKGKIDQGQDYGHAHNAATAEEHHEAAKAHSQANPQDEAVDPHAYERAIRPFVDAARKEYDPAGVPIDLEDKPYRDMNETHLIAQAAMDPARLKAAGTVVKLTQTDRPILPEEKTTALKDITLPLKPDASREEKLAEIHRMTQENKPIIDGLMSRIDDALGTESKSNVKSDESILAKADRPEIKAEKPWHDVEHIRDTFRFKTAINDLSDVPKVLNILRSAGVSMVKVDTAKMFAPKQWGWRFAGFDLRMPNGQMVEYYLPFKELEAVKADNHLIFEKWRNTTPEYQFEHRDEFARDQKASRDRYDQAFAEALSRTGVSENAARADWRNFESSLDGMSSNVSISSSADGMALDPKTNDPSGLRRAALPGTESEPRSENAYASPVEGSQPADTSRSTEESLAATPGETSQNTPAQGGSGAAFAQGPRGMFQAGDLGSVITLFDGANASTVFHELGHYFLDVMGKLAQRPDAPESLRADYQRILDFSGYGSHENLLAMRGELGELQRRIGDREPTESEKAELKRLSEPDEAFARTWEDYLREGRAPSIGLRKSFARLKTWLMDVYKGIRHLGVPLNDEIRGVFDRMLASEKEIANARERVADKPAFETQEESGFDNATWASYQRLVADKDRITQEHLEQELLDVERRTRQESYQREREEARTQVADQVGQTRTFSALSQLQDGEHWDGRKLEAPFKIQKSDIEKLLTPEERERLPGRMKDKNRGREIYTSDDKGISADDAALRLGYASGHELLQDLINAPDREAAIDQQTDAHMKALHPDPMDDQAQMAGAADRALHAQDIRSQLLDMERAQLGKLTGRTTAKSERQTMRVAARQMIMTTKLGKFDPSRFIAAERKAALSYAEAKAKKDWTKALAAKRAQMMNAELARSAMDAHEQAGKDQGRLSKLATDDALRTKIAKAGGWEWTVTYPDGSTKAYDQADEKGTSAQEQARTEAINKRGTYERTSTHIDAIDQLLEMNDFRDRTPKELRRRASLKQYLEKTMLTKGPDGEPIPTGDFPIIPPYLVEQTQLRHYTDMTVQELHDLRTAAESIVSIAELKNELLANRAKRRVRDIAAEIIPQMLATSGGVKKLPDGTTGILDSARRIPGNFFADLMQVPRLMYEMDGGKEAGPLQRHLLFPQIEAGDAELRMKADGRAKFAAAFKEWGKAGLTGYDIHARQASPYFDNGISLLNKIVLLRHYGNTEGRDRIMSLTRLDTDAKVMDVLKGLDAKDIALANRLTEIAEEHWSDVKALEEKFNGIAPPKVDAIPVELPGGTYKGGYQRIYYDGESASTLEHMAQQMAEEGMVGAGYRRAQTAHGYTKERTSTVKNRILSLDPGNWARGFNEEVHDLTHRELVYNQMKVLNNQEIRDAMVKHWGLRVYKQFVNQTMGLAQGSKPATTTMERTAEYLRVATNYSKRAFNPAYALIQEAGLTQVAARVKPQYMAAAQMELMSGPLNIDKMSHWIQEQSTTMKYRSRTRDANVGDALSETTLSGSMRKFMDGAGMFMVLRTWEHMDNVAWLGAYKQHMAETSSHKEAVNVANQVVESVMGSAKQKDLAEIQRAGGPLMKIFTSNMNWSLANWNMIATAWNKTMGLSKFGEGGWRQMAGGLASLGTLCVAGPMVWDYLRDLMKGDDLKEWQSIGGLAKKAALAPVYSALSSLPVLRDLEPALVEGRHTDGAVTGLNWMKALQKAGASLHARHYGEATGKALLGAAGAFLPLPASAIAQAMDGYQYSQHHNAGVVSTLWQMANGAPAKGK